MLLAFLIASACGSGPGTDTPKNENAAAPAKGDAIVDLTDKLPYDLVAVDMVDPSTGFIVGQDAENNVSMLLSTTTGGSSWKAVAEFRGDTLLDVDFVDKTHGWVVGTEGFIYKTEDGGRSWRVQTANGAEWIAQRKVASSEVVSESDAASRASINESIAAIQFVDAKTGWAAGDAPTGNSLSIRGVVYGTTNGGQTWTELKDREGHGAPFSINDIWFLNAREGWAVGGTFDDRQEDVLLHTTDGGKSWEQQKTGTAQYLRAVQFVTEKHGWVVGMTIDAVSELPGPSKILATSDGGKTWSIQKTVDRSFYDLSFVDPVTGIVVGDRATILFTVTAGTKWTQILDIDTANPIVVQAPPMPKQATTDVDAVRAFRTVFFVDAANGWAGGEGVILKYKGKS